MSSGFDNSAAPMPPLTENDLGQPILISTAATSLHLKKIKSLSIVLRLMWKKGFYQTRKG